MKTMDRRQVLSTMLASAGVLAWPRSAMAQGAAAAKWPVGTIKFIAPVPPGGGVDVFCRQLGERMAHHLGVTVVVENRAGAGGLLGAKALASAPADGSTLGYLHSGHASIQAMGGKLDLMSEFKPVIGRFQASAFAVVVHADSPYQTFGDLLKVLTEQPDKLSYGSGGLGTPAHIIFEKLKAARPGLSATQIPYKGAIEGVNALMGKNIDFLVGLMSTVLGPIKGGKLRALAVSSPARSRLLPGVPTIVESGVAGFGHVSWSGVFGPAGLPQPLVELLSGVLRKISLEPEFAAFVASVGSEVMPAETTAAFEAYLKGALATETALMSRLGLKA